MPDDQTAMVISSIVDRARAAMGWNALPQTSVRGEQSPQDLAIVSWFEICYDAGMRLEQYNPCYRAAQQRKRELLAQGVALTVVTPHDLCAELDRVRRMHAEIDRTRLLPENAAGACRRCFGTGFEEMRDGTVREGCEHLPLTAEEEAERKAEWELKAKKLREELAKRPVVKAMPAADFKHDLNVTYTCTACGFKKSSEFGWQYRERCKDRLEGPVREGERLECPGVLEIL